MLPGAPGARCGKASGEGGRLTRAATLKVASCFQSATNLRCTMNAPRSSRQIIRYFEAIGTPITFKSLREGINRQFGVQHVETGDAARRWPLGNRFGEGGDWVISWPMSIDTVAEVVGRSKYIVECRFACEEAEPEHCPVGISLKEE